MKVLIDTGVTEVECVVVKMSEEKEKALNIALNKISGEWDKEKLSLLISDLQLVDFDVSLTGFDAPEIDAFFKDAQRKGVQDDDFDVEAALKEPAITKPGDLWLLGKHRLVCGDSTKRDVFNLLMGFTVVPFGQGFKDMSPPTKKLMKLTLEHRIAHGGQPILRWMMDNIYIRSDPAGNIKPDKEKSTEKIDGAVATIMALDRALRNGGLDSSSIYDGRGLLLI